MALTKTDRARRTPELLAPAGGRSQLEAAVAFGADAVYLATDRFGLRARATNFSLDELPDAVSFAHAAGVSVYVTLNAVMDADDLAALPACMERLAAAGVDAFIVSDLGALRLARRHAPQVDIHVSTQASVSNAEAAWAYRELGATRVVVSREMSLEDIARLRQDGPADLEIEAFVHGAMCMAVSGRCLISSVMTNRSGNKGNCSQPCRWNYALMEEKRPGVYFPIEEDASGSYVMNAQDMNLLAHLDELAAAGIDSFKIEGRNKKAFYVATVVNAYRQVMDGADPALLMPELNTISHRPYGTGFYFGHAAQEPAVDGYVKECLHAATVEACEPVGEESWRIEVTCYNRFFEGDELEILAPGSWGNAVRVHQIVWRGEGDARGEEAVAVANRTSQRYAFITAVPLEPGTYLRKRL